MTALGVDLALKDERVRLMGMSTIDTSPPDTLDKHYNPQAVEARLYQFWEDHGLFSPETQKNHQAQQQPHRDKTPFSIVIPPPNVTGTLHIGHALDNTLQDILIRWHRMRGDDTLWMPGTDHAGIATQSLVEKQLRAETPPRNRFEMGRDAFLEKVWEWARYSEDTILGQFRRLGISPDWSRKRFTLDEGCSKAVRHAFKKLFDDGLIYRDRRIINWSPGVQSAISDIETEYTEEESFLYHIKYPLADGPVVINGTEVDGIVVATTRPETMFGDVAVAVHPEDDRYKPLIGKTVRIPLTEVDIPIIADDYVEKDFGTGALKITPGHDANDFDVAKRHQLGAYLVIGKNGHLLNSMAAHVRDGSFEIDSSTSLSEFPLVEYYPLNAEHTATELGFKLTEEAEKRIPIEFQNVERSEARLKIAEQLDNEGFLLKKESHLNRVGRCQRSGVVIEPMLSLQWFVRTKPLAKKCLKSLEQGHIKFVPERWTKTYTDWLENIRDWCISRQLWWGHQIPAAICIPCYQKQPADPTAASFYCDDDTPKQCPRCGSTEIQQDEDVLDTWFSSGLWPMSTMGWPDEQAPDFQKYYPTSVLVTGFDIIFFWVARMTMFGEYFSGQSPFSTVFIHGLVRDETGAKMSKSKGNVIDPVKMIDQYGCDAMRFSLVGLVTYGGQDIKLSEERFEQGKLYCNKLWNASRFVLMNLEGVDAELPDIAQLNAMDRWMLGSLKALVAETDKNLREFRVGEVTQDLYETTWTRFCDWYVEYAKKGLRDEATKLNTQRCLRYCLETLLKLHHPFMPFITEEIWQKLPHRQGVSISLSAFPSATDSPLDAIDTHTDAITFVIETIRGYRNTRQSMTIPPSMPVNVWLVSDETDERRAIETHQDLLHHFLKLESLVIQSASELTQAPERTSVGVVGKAKLYVQMPEGVGDSAEDKERQAKKLEKLVAEHDSLAARLNNPGFVDKAPAAVVAQNRERLAELGQQIATLKANG
jgi:valyl-tRNA synthetase